jgi:cell wall-associated NlpC family hydrolase
MKTKLRLSLLLSIAMSLSIWTGHFAHADDLSKLLQDKGLVQKSASAEGENPSTLSAFVDRTDQLIFSALSHLGVPYKRGGSNEELGFDCSGFVQSLYRNTLGLALPRSAAEQAKATAPIERQDLQPGDLVFFNTMRRAFSHVGIYMGDGKFIHAPRSGQKVRVESMKTSYWEKRFNGARRVQDRE